MEEKGGERESGREGWRERESGREGWRVSRRGGGSGGGNRGKRERLEHNKIYSLSFDC